MSLSVTEIYEALLIAGVPEPQAKAAAAIATAPNNSAKQELLKLRTEMNAGLVAVRAEMATKQDLAKFREKIVPAYTSINRDLAVLKFAVLTFEAVTIGLLLKIVFFPP